MDTEQEPHPDSCFLLKLHPSCVRMISSTMRGALERIKYDLREHSIDIRPRFVDLQLESEEAGFLITGSHEGLPEVTKRLQMLKDQIVQSKYVINDPKMSGITDTDGQIFLSKLEEEHSCLIEACIHSAKESDLDVDDTVLVERISTEAPLWQVKDECGVWVKVYTGDISKHLVDVIVNPADTKLKHGSGLVQKLICGAGTS